MEVLKSTGGTRSPLESAGTASPSVPAQIRNYMLRPTI